MNHIRRKTTDRLALRPVGPFRMGFIHQYTVCHYVMEGKGVFIRVGQGDEEVLRIHQL